MQGEGDHTQAQEEVTWFGRTFSATGVSADPKKINAIFEAGRPKSTDEVLSLIQPAAYNARFMFDPGKTSTYEDTTAPLRELLAKGAIFSWDKRREGAYQTLMRMMSSEATLRPFIQGLPTWRRWQRVAPACPPSRPAGTRSRTYSPGWCTR